MPFQEVLFKPSQRHLHGATLGESHFAEAVQLIAAGEGDAGIVFDLSDVVSVTASYLKATLLRILKSKRGEALPSAEESSSTAMASHLFAFVAGCSPEVAADLHEFFVGRGLPLILLDHWDSKRLIDGRLLGTLDPVLFRTLQGVIKLKECTASGLADISSEKITVNGWSNRLADLYQLALVTRRRESKFWYYSAIIERITLWD